MKPCFKGVAPIKKGRIGMHAAPREHGQGGGGSRRGERREMERARGRERAREVESRRRGRDWMDWTGGK